MPTLRVFVAPPDDWQEFVVTNEEGISHRLQASGKLAPFQTEVTPKDEGWDAIQIDFVCTEQKQNPYIGFYETAYAWVPVDMSALSWIKEHWAKGRRIELTIHGENVPGFSLGSAPDGGDVIWDRTVAKHVKLSQAVLSAQSYREETETQAIEAPLHRVPVHPDLQASLTKISSRLGMLLGVAVLFVAYYWTRK